MRKVLAGILLFATVGMLSSCSFTLNGASIPDEMKTINVEYFENNAPFVVNNLSQQVTEAIKQRIRSQTRLSIVRNPEADAVMTGYISTYSIAPVSVPATGSGNQAPIANASRLTMTIHVKYAYKKDKKLDFEQDFTRYADYTGDLASKEQGLIANINKQLTEDIFNKAFANWN